MRLIPILALLLQGDPFPPPVAAAADQVVQIYSFVTCKDIAGGKIPARAGRGTGFFVNERIVATVFHYFATDWLPMPVPDFAVVDAFGCRDALVVDVHVRPLDVMFLHVRGRRSRGLPLSDRMPKVGEQLWRVSPWRRLPPDGKTGYHLIASRVIETPNGTPKQTVLFSARPAPAAGDSGSPILDADGNVIGMVHDSYGKDSQAAGLFHSAGSLKTLMTACAPCEE